MRTVEHGVSLDVRHGIDTSREETTGIVGIGWDVSGDGLGSVACRARCQSLEDGGVFEPGGGSEVLEVVLFGGDPSRGQVKVELSCGSVQDHAVAARGEV